MIDNLALTTDIHLHEGAINYCSSCVSIWTAARVAVSSFSCVFIWTTPVVPTAPVVASLRALLLALNGAVAQG